MIKRFVPCQLFYQIFENTRVSHVDGSARKFIQRVNEYIAQYVYPQELTHGINDGASSLQSYEALHRMELLVLARALSTPEPSKLEGSYIVSKSWVRDALKWLEKCENERERDVVAFLGPEGKMKSKKKKPTRKERMRSRRLSDISPPCPDVNVGLTCHHGELALIGSARKANASRRLMDKYAFKVLRKLYPEGKAFKADQATECLQCRMQLEMDRKAEADRKSEEEEQRKLPLSHPLIRAFYLRNKGVPLHCLVRSFDSDKALNDLKNCVPVNVGTPQKLGTETESSEGKMPSSGKAMLDGSVKVPHSIYTPPEAGIACPLVPGVYHVLPRSWCARWRRYIKNGGERPTAPEATELLCDAHKLPLIPPHLKSFLYGKADALLSASSSSLVVPTTEVPSNLDEEIAAFRFAQAGFDHNHRMAPARQALPRVQNSSDLNRKKLDRENHVVVEILTAEEYSALEEYWPEFHSKFVLRFAVCDEVEMRKSFIEGYGFVEEQFMATRITWCTNPCSECYAGGSSGPDIAVRNRNREFFRTSV